MTIKRRLFISNILMIIIPIVLSTIILIITSLIFTGVKGVNYDYFGKKSELKAVYEKWTDDTDIATIKAELEDFSTNTHKPSYEYFYLIEIAYAVVIVIILLTNRVLVGFVFRNVIKPIDTLVYGVNQIRDGNLQYRIDYTKKDEFSGICFDFNEMAKRLSDFVALQQKEETNRKELIAGISHDLRTPLTSIKAYVEGLEKGIAATPETQKKYLETIKNKSAELERIINQLFMFSKIDIGEFPFNLEKINIITEINDTIASISEEYEKNGLTISYLVSENKAYVSLDTQQFRNVIINIIENSLKYKVKNHGTLEISTHTDKNIITIELKDNGPGVSEAAINKIFDVFYRCDPSRASNNNGSGLGLAITAKILERLGGSIRAKNAVEGGLIIIITLPIFRSDNN